MKEKQKLFLKAAPGRRVKDPETLRLLDEAGEFKPATSFWNRRLRDGDVIEATPPVKAPAKAPALKQLPKDKE